MKNLDIIDRHTINLLNKHDLLKKLIKSEFIENEIYSIKCDPQELDNFKEEVAKKLNVKNFEQLKKSNTDATEDSFRKQFQMDIFVTKKFENKVEAKFLEIKNSLDQVVYSIIRVTNSWLAKELYFKLIEDNISFGQLAREYSTGPERDTRGIIGPSSFESLHPKLRDLLRTSEMGKINPPITIAQFSIISRLEDSKPAQLNDNTKLFIKNLLFNEWLDIKVSEELLNIQNKLNQVSSQSIS